MTTTDTATATPPGYITCPNEACGAVVAPTRVGGSRPRIHLLPDGSTCPSSRDTFELPRCDRCGGAPDQPGEVPGPSGALRQCRSGIFHPRTWTAADGTRVVNAAAAGKLVGVSGKHYQQLVWRPREAARAPRHVTVDDDGTRGYPLAAVRRFAKPGARPGPRAGGRVRTD